MSENNNTNTNEVSKEIPEELYKKIMRTKELAYYCYGCGKCLNVCPTAQIGIFSPKSFIHNVASTPLSDLDKLVKEEKLFNCLTCGKCEEYCPMALPEQGEGVLIHEIVQGLREYGYKKHLLDDVLPFYNTHDNMMKFYSKNQSRSDDVEVNKIDYIKNDPGLKISDKGELGFFIGCASLMEDIFYNYNIKYKDIPRAVISILNEVGIEPVVLEMKCCGHDNYWMGDMDTAKRLAEYNVRKFKEAGVKKIIVECAEGYQMWKYEYPKLVEDCDFEVQHFTQFILENKIMDILIPQLPEKIKVTYHDPCRLGRLGGVYEPPRDILKGLDGIDLVEMPNNRKDSNCCGISGFLGCNSKTKLIRQDRVEEARNTGAEYLITTCPKCITHFSCYEDELKDDGVRKQDSDKIKIMDLATFIAKYTQKL
ncbi:MAG: (Fe-S)-binding protein [Promethearchaeota archaeon]